MAELHDKILNYVKKRNSITVPELSHRFSLPYSLARQEMTRLVQEDAVTFEKGIRYKVKAMPDEISSIWDMLEKEEPDTEERPFARRRAPEPRRPRFPRGFGSMEVHVDADMLQGLLKQRLSMDADGVLHPTLPVSLPDGTPLRFRYEVLEDSAQHWISDDGSVYEYLERIAPAEGKEEYLERTLLEINLQPRLLVCGQKLFVRLNGITEEEELTQRFLDFYRGLWLYFNQKLRPNGEEN